MLLGAGALHLEEPKTSESGCGVCSQQGRGGCGGAAKQGLRQPTAGSQAAEAASSMVQLSPGGRWNQSHPIPIRAFQERHAQVAEPLLPASSTAGWILIDPVWQALRSRYSTTFVTQAGPLAETVGRSRLLAEAKYYLVQGLVEEC